MRNGARITFLIAAAIAVNQPPISQAQDRPILDQPDNSTRASDQAAAQSDAAITQEVELAKVVFQDQLIQSWMSDPASYSAMKEIAHNPMLVKKWEQYYVGADYRKQQIQEFTTSSMEFGLPLGAIIGFSVETSTTIDSREKRLLSYELMSAKERSNFYREMQDDYTSVQSLAKRYADLAYQPDATSERVTFAYMLDFYSRVIQPRNKLAPDPTSYELLMANSNSPASILSRLNLDARDIRGILAGTKTLQDVIGDKGSTPDEVQRVLLEINVEFHKEVSRYPNPDQVMPGDTSLDLANLMEKEREISFELERNPAKYTVGEIEALTRQRGAIADRIRTIKLREHSIRTQKMRDYGALFQSTTDLLFPDSEPLKSASIATAASIEIYDAVGAMLINGALDPTGVSTTLNSVNTLVSLFNRKDRRSQEVELLMQVLENQKRILDLLSRVDQKVDALAKDVSQLQASISKLSESLAQINDGIIELSVNIELRDSRAAQRQQQLAQDDFVEIDRADSEKFLVDFRNGTGATFRDAIKCMALSDCSETSIKLFTDIKQQASVIHFRATSTLVNSTAFQGGLNYIEMSSEVIADRLRDSPEFALEELPDLINWINARFSNENSSFTPVDASKFTDVPHPFYLTEVYIPIYVRLVSHLPAYEKANDTSDVTDLINLLRRVSDSSNSARSSLPTVLVGTKTAAEDLTNEISLFFRSQESAELVDFDDVARRIGGDSAKIASILKTGPGREITSYLMTLPSATLGDIFRYIRINGGLRMLRADGQSDVFLQVSVESAYRLGLKRLSDNDGLGVKVSAGDQVADLAEKTKLELAETLSDAILELRRLQSSAFFGRDSIEYVFDGREEFRRLFYLGSGKDIRNYLSSLSNSEYLFLGDDLGVFQLVSIGSPGEKLSHYINFTDLAVAQLDVVQVSDNSNKGVLIYENGQPMPDSGLRYQDKKLFAGDTLFDFGTEVSLSPENHLRFDDAVLKAIESRRAAMIESWRERLSIMESELGRNVVVSAFVSQKFLQIGFGDCLTDQASGVALGSYVYPLASLSDLSLAVVNADHVGQLFSSSAELYSLVEKLPVDIPAADALDLFDCQLGWGAVDLANQSLESLKLIETP